MRQRRIRRTAVPRPLVARAIPARPTVDIRLQIAFVILAIVMAASRAFGADAEPLTVKVAPVKVKAGASISVPVTIQLTRGWHIFGAQPLVQGVKPARLTVAAAKGVDVGAVHMPQPKKERVAALNADANVYEGAVRATVDVKAGKGAAAGRRELSGELSYQACSNTRCLFPKKLKFTVPVEVVR